VSTQRNKYFNTLGFSEDNESKRGKALDRAYQLRTFEIEHYWKRATYFWAFQAAIFAAVFAALGLRNPNAATDWGPITVALSVLGLLTAVGHSLSARGSKFWQENWEKHIDMLEDKIKGRLHKTIWLPEGKVSFSVSEVNQTLSFFFIAFWVVVILYVAYKFVGLPSLEYLLNISAWWLIIAVIIAIGVGWLLRQTSGLDDHADVPNKRHSRWHRRISPPQTFIRRYAPEEPDKGEGTKVA
jgi:hypothetical protein